MHLLRSRRGAALALLLLAAAFAAAGCTAEADPTPTATAPPATRTSAPTATATATASAPRLDARTAWPGFTVTGLGMGINADGQTIYRVLYWDGGAEVEIVIDTHDLPGAAGTEALRCFAAASAVGIAGVLPAECR